MPRLPSTTIATLPQGPARRVFFLRQLLAEHTLCLMNIAPYPSRRRDSAHDRMLRLMEMFSRVLACRGIATANVAARLALAKSNPNGALS